MIKFKKYGGLVFSLSLLLVVGIAWNQKQAIYDWYRLRNYDPSSAIVKLAEATTMDSNGRKIFYVSHPKIESKADFNSNCPSQEKTIILGCYVKNQGIYIYDVKDPKLSGIKEVTAAHEMLHAAYDRLSSGEKTELIKTVMDAYSNLNDKRIKKNIDAYKKAGADIADELHSILGTEVKKLPEKLETYYRKYFDDRLKIVAYSEKYETVFTKLDARATSLNTQIKAFRSQIAKLQSELSTKRNDLESRRNSASSQAQVAAFNGEVNQYNVSLNDLNELINTYNNLVKDYNNLALQQRELYKSIDSSPNPL